MTRLFLDRHLTGLASLAGLATFLLAAVIMGAASPAGATPKPGATWDWQLSEPVKPPAVAAFDTDPDIVTRAQIRALNAAGVYTICYVSVGTREEYRDDADRIPAEVVGKTYGDWPDERFLDIRRADLLAPIMQARFQRCKAMGFDAIEPDNLDVHDNDSGFDISAADTVRYASILAHMAHEMGLEIGQKNVPELTPDLVGLMNFAVTESCFQDKWCQQMSPYVAAGKPVFDAEYTDRRINWNRACKQAARLGNSMILKDRDLHAGMKRCAT